MFLNRAALEILNKEELILIFAENDDKLNSNLGNITNQLVEVNKTLEKNTHEKCITSLEKQFWRNEQYSRREFVEILGIPDSTNETKACE